jgi:hypothetical protein
LNHDKLPPPRGVIWDNLSELIDGLCKEKLIFCKIN